MRLAHESATLAVRRVEEQVEVLRGKLEDMQVAEEAAHTTAANANDLVASANTRRKAAEEQVCVCTYTHTYTTHTYTRTHTHTHTHSCARHPHPHARAHTHKHTQSHTYTATLPPTHTRTHTHCGGKISLVPDRLGWLALCTPTRRA